MMLGTGWSQMPFLMSRCGRITRQHASMKQCVLFDRLHATGGVCFNCKLSMKAGGGNRKKKKRRFCSEKEGKRKWNKHAVCQLRSHNKQGLITITKYVARRKHFYIIQPYNQELGYILRWDIHAVCWCFRRKCTSLSFKHFFLMFY